MTTSEYFEQYVKAVGGRTAASKRLGITLGAVGHILNGRRGMSPEMALKIEQDSNGIFKKEKFIWPDHAA